MAHANHLVGKLIHDLRKQQNITGIELGRRAAMSQSKLSKIENGYYPTVQLRDIERLLNILNAPNTLRQRIYKALKTSQGPKNKMRLRFYSVRYSNDLYERDRGCTTFDIFSPYIVPAFLQTNEYRLALLRSWGTAEDDLQILRNIHKRQELLWDAHRHFHFIMHEALLYSSFPGHDHIDLKQLDRLEQFIGVPNIKIGIIPLKAGMPLVEYGPFALLDQRIVTTATPAGEITLTDNQSVVLHNQLFADLHRLAVYGAEARQYIRAAAAFFGL